MTCVLSLQQFKVNNLLYNNRIKNNVVENSNFIGLHYSNPYMTLNNVPLHFTLENINVDMYYNKYKCEFKPSTSSNINTIKQLCYIERMLLDKYKPYTKSKPCLKLFNILTVACRIKLNFFEGKKIRCGSIKKGDIVLKISGLWENKDEYGIIYKFFMI